MGKVKEIYKHNIYGVIATLTFHVLILTILILSKLNINEQSPPEAITLDFAAPDMQPAVQEIIKGQKPKTVYIDERMSVSDELISNRAVNDGAKSSAGVTSQAKDPFFDKAYNKEIADAKKLVSEVNRTLAKKIPDIGDITMPVDNAEGKTREEVKQSDFKGKSNIHYSLGNRYHSILPIPVYLAEGGGEVIVDITVGRDGRVLSANPRPNPQITDFTILAYAKQAAEKTLFNEDALAPEKQQGTITYRFLAQ